MESIMSKSKPRISLVTAILLGVVIGSNLGCGGMWKRVREWERTNSVSNAREYAKRGDCEKAINSLDKATARIDIGAFGKEATILRLRCYERQERWAAARAHQRLLDDFYTAEEPAYPSPDGSSVFRVKSIRNVKYENPPSAFEIAPPQYSDTARRSYIDGRVVISFELTDAGKAKAIRVFEMPHPLLASWAIEAIEAGKRSRKHKDVLLVPGSHYLTTFVFEYRWANEGQQVDQPFSADE
jgi:hypothetical protein